MKRPKRDSIGERGAFAKGVETFWLADTVACEHADIPDPHSPLASFPLDPTRAKRKIELSRNVDEDEDPKRILKNRRKIPKISYETQFN